MIEVNKIAIPFGRDGNKNTIYDTRQQGQAENDATWSTGFPPITMQDKTDGGLPPKGLDFNGIFYDISSNVVFSCMGGQYQFDAEYAEKIGGYPKGAILMNNALDKQYISNTDKNKIDFNSADSASLTAWSIISIKDIDKLLAGKIDNADFSTALNLKADSSTQIIAGNGITGGGTLQSNRTLTLGTPSKIEETSKNAVTASSHTHEIAKASTSTMGITKLSSVISDAEDVAATPKSVSTAQSRADSAYALAEKKIDKTSIANTLGTSTSLVASQAPVSSHGLGYGQSWVDVTSDRVKDTTYTNNTGKPIMISINKADSRALGSFIVDGVDLGVSRATVSGSYLSFVVPPNSSYSYSGVFEVWGELR